MTPFYNPALSYEENYEHGPFGAFARPGVSRVRMPLSGRLFGLDVETPFGIPSGPLLNARYVAAAFRHGFDFCVYKTVRTSAHASHPLPNILAVHPAGSIAPVSEPVRADDRYDEANLSITNSFGVPSFTPDIWQPDMAAAEKCAGRGQILAGSFQGTPGNGAIEDDYALAARLVAETGVAVLEANLSCPNEGNRALLCFDVAKVERIVHAVKNVLPEHPLILKIAYFRDDAVLRALVNRVGHMVDGFSAVNTLPAKPVAGNGAPALSANRPEGGICGRAIRWAGLDMTARLADLRDELGLNYRIIGVGGVSDYGDYRAYRAAGADAVMAATAALWNPRLALSIKEQLVTGFVRDTFLRSGALAAE
ncbi:MAG: hypothetical protein LBR29_01115 [Methylobacteriaceae bacterium]|jgi:dihydroorotate dehydrogenase|nr:hypothetical protein [Methylobacteriaceae bacterium]